MTASPLDLPGSVRTPSLDAGKTAEDDRVCQCWRSARTKHHRSKRLLKHNRRRTSRHDTDENLAVESKAKGPKNFLRLSLLLFVALATVFASLSLVRSMKLAAAIVTEMEIKNDPNSSLNTIATAGASPEDASSLPLPDLEIVVGHCREDLSYLDAFGSCDGLHFHIFSPCNGTIPGFKHVQDCVSIHRDVKNCGRETYSYFDYVIKRYDTLPKQIAFLQGEARKENPEFVQDIRNRMDGVSYAGLGRIVRSGWHMKNDTVRQSLQDRLAPGLRTQKSWTTSWRSQFLISRSTIKRHPRSAYAELNEAICEKKCKHVQCSLEVWLGPLFGCAPYLFDDESECEKKTLNWTLPISNVISEGETKAFKRQGSKISSQTKSITCGNRTIFYSREGHVTNNGILVCTEQ